MNSTKILSAGICFFLIGCVSPQSPYSGYLAGKSLQNYAYKDGVSFVKMQNDVTNCEIEAARRVPQNTMLYTTPSYTTPTRAHCSQLGAQVYCNTTGGQTYGGNVRSYDANTGLRLRAYGQCLVKKGYQFPIIPACPKEVDISAQQNEKKLRPFSSRTCYKYDKQGRFSIGNG